eukprot:SAG31_NODE_1838_length_7128_cov_4.274125_6_plen_95_part_00
MLTLDLNIVMRMKTGDASSDGTYTEAADLYVLLLADVFENFRRLCMNDDELDPAHYYTLPNYSWDAMMKRTGALAWPSTLHSPHLVSPSACKTL